ncbi:MAG: allantoinase AllB, partial [Microlunatus sp.]|nr:allantoinase AllB [Microlunatus sp.]
GDPVPATIAGDDDTGTAVIEMASASGLGLLPTDDHGVARRDARTASSRGTGEMIVAALDAGCRRIVLGVGGSANTDGGAGMMTALGVRLLNADGAPVAPGGGGLSELVAAEIDDLDARLSETEVVLAADVTNPLLGDNGAAAVFGPQKGASPDDVAQLDRNLARLVEALAEAAGPAARQAADAPGAGAAGGVGYAALALLGAVRRPGIEVVIDLVGLGDLVRGADVVITGEGSLDGQSLGGKTPLGVASLARQHEVTTVLAVCGRTTLAEAEHRSAGFDRVWALTDIESDVARCMSDAGPLLRRLGASISAYLMTTDGVTMSSSPSTDSSRIAEVNRPERIREQIEALRHDRGEPRNGGEQSPAATPIQAERTAAYDLVIKGRRILTTAGIAEREIGIVDGTIVAIEPYGRGLQGTETITLTEEETLIPGLVDAHVHVNEPGRTDWEGFASATKAAAAGGVTTIIDMPLNSIPSTVNGPALELKRLVAEGQAFVDLGFWGGAVPGNLDDLRELHDDGVFGFKCFLLHSGVDEFPHLEADELEEYLRVLVSYDALMIVHAEDSRTIDRAPQPDGDVYARFLASRPRGAENLAIAEVIERTRWTGARTHILHLSSSDALPMLATAKADGLDITVETCPHYLTLMAEEIPNGGTAYKCCPPIREIGN